jgi:hypothetical protein
MSARWFGWLYEPTGWEKVCGGDTLQTCATRLDQEASRRGVEGAGLQVMTHGAAPAFTPPTKQPRKPPRPPFPNLPTED